MYFYDRKDAGEKLAKLLTRKYANKHVVVYGLPRGGVITACEVAKRLHAPLQIIVTRKIGHPLEPEYAIAAISEHGHLIHETDEIHSVHADWLQKEIAKQEKEISRRKLLYGIMKRQTSLEGKTVIIVDDGIATGLTTRAAIADLKDLHPAKIVVAIPVIPLSVSSQVKKMVDEIVAIEVSEDFLGSIGAYYQYFPQVTDDEVIAIMKQTTLL